MSQKRKRGERYGVKREHRAGWRRWGKGAEGVCPDVFM